MAHFAEIDENNIVTRVVVVDDSYLIGQNGKENEDFGIAFCCTYFNNSTRNNSTKWLQTSYNGNFRKNYAGVGFTYSYLDDAFIPPCPDESFVLDKTTFTWKPPESHNDESEPNIEDKIDWSKVPENLRRK
jgi:hypothetical protein